MNRGPILGLTVTILLAQTLATPAAAAAPQASTQVVNSQPKPNDAFVDVHDFVFGDGETLASLKLHYLTLGRRVATRVAQSPMGCRCFTAPPDRLPTSLRPNSSIRFTTPGSRSTLASIFL